MPTKAELTERVSVLEEKYADLKDRYLLHLEKHYNEMDAAHADIFRLQELNDSLRLNLKAQAQTIEKLRTENI